MFSNFSQHDVDSEKLKKKKTQKKMPWGFSSSAAIQQNIKSLFLALKYKLY